MHACKSFRQATSLLKQQAGRHRCLKMPSEPTQYPLETNTALSQSYQNSSHICSHRSPGSRVPEPEGHVCPRPARMPWTNSVCHTRSDALPVGCTAMTRGAAGLQSQEGPSQTRATSPRSPSHHSFKDAAKEIAYERHLAAHSFLKGSNPLINRSWCKLSCLGSVCRRGILIKGWYYVADVI